MNQTQRVVLMVYCLFLTYCCVWVPWQIVCGTAEEGSHYITYSLLWAPPQGCAVSTAVMVLTPHLPMIALRLAALTAFAAAVFLFFGKGKL
jgi:hypothetical protein